MAHVSLSDWSVLNSAVPEVDDSILREDELSPAEIDVDADVVTTESETRVDDSEEEASGFETGFKFFRDGKLSDSTSFVDWTAEPPFDCADFILYFSSPG